MKPKTTTFVFNCAWRDSLREYPDNVRLEVYEAIIDYAATGQLPQLQGSLARMALNFIRRDIDYCRNRYAAISEKRRSAGRRSHGAAEQPAIDEPIEEPEQPPSPAAAPEPAAPDYCPYPNCNADSFIADFFDSKRDPIIEPLCMQLAITPKEFRSLAETVVNEWAAATLEHPTRQDAYRHLISQVRIKTERQRTKNPSEPISAPEDIDYSGDFGGSDY